MFALGPRSRAALAAGGIAAFALAFATTPLVAPSAAAPPLADAAPPLAAPAPAAPPAELPRRDPFAGPPDPPASRPPAPVPAAIPTLPPLPAFPGAIGPLPPNAGALGGPLPAGGHGAAAGARVTAVVTGPHPYALIEDSSGTRVVAPGDTVAGERVTAIDAAGVHLTHGAALSVDSPDRSSASPSFPVPLGGLP